MSAPRLIYPLLDGFLLGDAISCHDGVQCYPAIQQKTGEKYIVKVISVPSSRVQLDALLLTGAFADKDGALAYFKGLARDLAQEAQILQQLSQQEGFVCYEDCQTVTAADGDGYDVYLLGKFRQSLDRVFTANAMTHRNVLELGLDLCAALAACRRAGYLYVDLKPSNIFYSEEYGSRIGDIGFVSLSSMQFTPLHNQYHSRYTAPEMADDLSVINDTLDVYALGMVLYQACNGGVLPNADAIHMPPLYADYSLAEIILKACHTDPCQRWKDPTQMAHALINYMQQNEVTDLPLIPRPIVEEAVETEDFLPEATAEELALEMAQLPPEEMIMAEPANAQVPSEAEDITDMLAQVDDLIAHTPPEPVIAPEPVVLPIPEPILAQSADAPEEEPKTAPVADPPAQEEVKKDPPTPDAPADAPLPPEQPAEPEDTPRRCKPFPWRAVLIAILAVLIFLCSFLIKRYYDSVYLQHIDELVISHTDDTATVKIVSSIDESLLRVICSDSYGNTKHSSVTAGIALFTDLQPQTRYTVRVEISGKHQLTGMTSSTFTTPEQPFVHTFTACMGSLDCSVLLTLTASGPAVERWVVTYRAEGTAVSSIPFTGNSVQITGLQHGLTYTFDLSAENQSVGGTTQTQFTATQVILAQQLAVTACGGGSLTAQWQAPDNMIPESGWAVHCYDGSGFDETIVTYEPWYTFIGMDHSTECTVEVTAVGMYQSVSASVSANPITIESYSYSVSTEKGLTIQWTCSSPLPEGGWVVDYTVDGVAYTLLTQEPSASVYALPGGVYCFYIRAADGTAVFGGSSGYTLTEVGPFSGFGIQADQLQASVTLPQLTLTADSQVLPEASQEEIEILYILRSGEGVLLDYTSVTTVWDTLWQENICTLEIPNVPENAGLYRLSVYFSGGLICDLEFTVA